jgi:alkylation response protein AidB-like acyl-CoA dehydrogenase
VPNQSGATPVSSSSSSSSKAGIAESARVPILDDLTARAVAEELGAVFALGAAERDRGQEAPYQQMHDLVRTGLLAVTVPAEYGGADVSPETVADILRVTGRADPNIAQIQHGHFVNAHLLRVAGNTEQKRFFFAEILGGAVLGTAQSDVNPKRAGTGPAADPAAVPTRLTRYRPGVFRLNGAKARATGAQFARWLPTLARLEDGTPEGGEELVAFVAGSADGVTVTHDSDDFGQRTAASGRVEFVDVSVPSEHILRRGKALAGTHAVGSFSQLLHAAIEVGIAGGVLAEAAEFVRTTARAAHESYALHAIDDPLLIQRLGEMTVDVRAAEATLLVAAGAVTESILNPSDAAATEAAVAVATAKVLAERAALAVTSGTFEVGGAASTSRSLNLDRHWRNARTHSLEDPIRWKYHHLGRFTLLGLSPPRHRPI